MFGIFFHAAANAASQTLIISGGYGADLDDPWYRTISKIGFEAETARDRSVYVAAKDNKWDFPISGKRFPARSEADIEEAIKKAASNLKRGDSLFLFITDHGGAPSSETDPLSSKIVLWGPDAWSMPAITHKKLLSLLEKYVPKDASIKLAGTHCFSGGLHSVAFALPNTCSIASTDFRTPSLTAYDKNKSYTYGLWQEIKEKRFDLDGDNKTSLQEAHLDAIVTDTENENRSDISSTAYIDFVLQEGPYKHVDSILRRVIMLPASETSTTNTKKADCEICIDVNQIRLASELENLAATIVPLVSGSIYDYAAKDWKKNGNSYITKLNGSKAQYAKLLNEWNGLSTSDKKIRSAEYTAKFEELRKKTNVELAKFMAITRLIKNKEKINRFLKIATPEQKAKFAQLMKCEGEPL